MPAASTSAAEMPKYTSVMSLEHGAIVPQWEADTARLQSANRLNDAGLSEEDRAARAGKLAGRLAAPQLSSPPAPLPPAGEGRQVFRPMILDLDGDGIALADQAHSGVAFDVDDSGYLKATGWLANEGANSVVAVLCLWAYRRQNPLSLHSCPKWTANDPEHRAAA